MDKMTEKSKKNRNVRLTIFTVLTNFFLFHRECLLFSNVHRHKLLPIFREHEKSTKVAICYRVLMLKFVILMYIYKCSSFYIVSFH